MTPLFGRASGWPSIAGSSTETFARSSGSTRDWDRCTRLQATDHEAAYGLSRLCPVALAPGKLNVELHRDGRPLIDIGASLAEAHDRCLAREPAHLDIGVLGPEYSAEESH